MICALLVSIALIQIFLVLFYRIFFFISRDRDKSLVRHPGANDVAYVYIISITFQLGMFVKAWLFHSKFTFYQKLSAVCLKTFITNFAFLPVSEKFLLLLLQYVCVRAWYLGMLKQTISYKMKNGWSWRRVWTIN